MLNAMANLLMIAVGVLAVGGIFLRLALAWRGYRLTPDTNDDNAFEKDIEWQLQHELDDAIEASTRTSSTLAEESADERQSLISPTPNSTLHVHYQDSSPPPGSSSEFRALYKFHYDNQLGLAKGEAPQVSLDPYDQLVAQRDAHYAATLRRFNPNNKAVFTVDDLMNGAQIDNDAPIVVNPKQFHRILKRRMARTWIQRYFEAQKIPERERRTTRALNSHAMRMESEAMAAA